MPTRRSILVGTAIVAGTVLWYLFRPEALSLDRIVNEPLPVAEHSISAMAESPAMVDSPMGVKLPEKLAGGRFHSNAHETRGSAAVFLLADGRRVLRLTEFATANGPDVRVYFVAAANVQYEATAKEAGLVDLGALKGNIGDQNYDIPADLDLTRFRAVPIWCRRFSVNFGAAPLAEMAS
jgi:hypothetical protein